MPKTTTGDVFLIPLDGERFGIGQIAGNWNGELYAVVFDKLVSMDAAPEDVNGANLAFAALTLDAKLHHGDWTLIGNHMGNLPALPQPWFKVGVLGETHIESRDRSMTRRATRAESERLRFRSVVAPVRIENAFKALHGFGEWNARFDDLKSHYAYESENLVCGQ